MRAPSVVLVLLLAVVVVPVLAKDDPNATKPADKRLRKLVADAIDRGAAWLSKRQAEDGSFFGGGYGASYPMGPTGLSLLALLHSGVSPRDAGVQRALHLLRKRYRRQKERGALRTYSIAVTIMALVEYGRVLGSRGLPPEDRKWLEEMTKWLVGVQSGSGGWHYPNPAYDHSNSQYALLALKEARRAGVEVSERVFARALSHFLSAQEKDGPRVPRFVEQGGDGVYSAGRRKTAESDRARGWGYVVANPATGSMTAAGVAAVEICRSELAGAEWKRLRENAEVAVRDGLAWLGRSFTVKGNPPGGSAWHYYYLYGLERAGVLAGRVYMGEHRWYAEGAKYLVDSQSPDGLWRTARPWRRRGGGGQAADVVDHCFALLFLARATARSLGVATEAPLLDLTEAEKLADRDLEALFTAAFGEMERIGEEDAAKDRAKDFAFLGPRVIGLLLPRLLSPEESVRARAALILRAVTGRRADFDPAGTDEAREAAADRWTMWWLSNRGKLKFEREAGLIR